MLHLDALALGDLVLPPTRIVAHLTHALDEYIPHEPTHHICLSHVLRQGADIWPGRAGQGLPFVGLIGSGRDGVQSQWVGHTGHDPARSHAGGVATLAHWSAGLVCRHCEEDESPTKDPAVFT